MTEARRPAEKESAAAPADASARAETNASDAPRSEDRALVVGALPAGEGLAVLRQRARGGPVEAGVVRPLQEGKPIVGEVVKLVPDPEVPIVCSVETQLDAPRARTGPAQVASERYREGWDRVFGPTERERNALN